MTDIEEALRVRIDEILCYIWDPIGVSSDGTPETRDEYSSYTNGVLQAVLEGKSKYEISEMLTTITTERMGLDPRVEDDDAIAAIILDLARYLKERS